MADELDIVARVLERQLRSGGDLTFASITLDLFGHLSNAIHELRIRSVVGWSTPMIRHAVRLDWIWLLATQSRVFSPDEPDLIVEFDDFREDVIGGLRWYLRSLGDPAIDFTRPIQDHPAIDDLELRHSVFALPIAQALVRGTSPGHALLDRLKPIDPGGNRARLH